MAFDSYFFIISGLLGGLVATICMTVFEIPFWKKWGLKGILEWHENQILYSKLTNNNPNRLNLFGIFLLHLINGGLGGIGFYLLLNLIPFLISSVHIVGSIYGLVLWILTLLPIHKPITGIDPFSHPQGVGPLVVSLCGHLIYGIMLSLVFTLSNR
ncbi:MAG TPA: hypothetical protein VJR94_08430 [Candidatus Nitrosocosmicus sp.]|nr:hypothetical protein [Candidatus Nitrosocosmicus sp.]